MPKGLANVSRAARARNETTRLLPLAGRPRTGHSFEVASFCLVNLEASHFEDSDDKGPVGQFCACNGLIKCPGKPFDVRWPRHCLARAEGTRMEDSRFAEFLRLQEGREASRDAVEGLRLLRMFIRLSPEQRRAILALVENYLRH